MSIRFKFLTIIILLLSCQNIFATDTTVISLPAFANQSPGADFLWGSADDETDLATQFPGEVGLNTIGGAGFSIDSIGGRTYNGIGTAVNSAVNGVTMSGEEYQFNTLSNGIEFQAFMDGVGGTQTRATNPTGAGKTFLNNTYSYNNVINIDTFGNTIVYNSTSAWWINNGEDIYKKNPLSPQPNER